MKLVCTEITRNSVWSFTVGKNYNAIGSFDDYIHVVDDFGLKLFLFKYDDGIKGAGVHSHKFKEAD